MKLYFDNDATLVDFQKFIRKCAIPYFQKKYHLEIQNPDVLEIEEIFDLKSYLLQQGCKEEELATEEKKLLNKFWISHRYVKYSLLNPLRPGAAQLLRTLKKQGHQIEIHTSRAMTCNKNLIGLLARWFTIGQYYLNGVFLKKSQFHFYRNDEQKIEGILCEPPVVLFEDKPLIISQISEQQIKVMCVEGTHNKHITSNNEIRVINSLEYKDVEKNLENLLGKSNYKYYQKEAESEKLYAKLKHLKPLVWFKFKPIVLHEERRMVDCKSGIIYAPNHRSTLDPIIIEGAIGANIHWAALLRFFLGEDSIFNNSKNQILCKITAKTFKRLHFFPIDRKSDNEKANNFEAIKDMLGFLRIHGKVGIFGEGTTRRAENLDFNKFDDSFLVLAKKSDAWVQPITTLWTQSHGLKNKVIINIGEAFKVGDMDIDAAMEHFMEIQRKALQENMRVRDELN